MTNMKSSLECDKVLISDNLQYQDHLSHSSQLPFPKETRSESTIPRQCEKMQHVHAFAITFIQCFQQAFCYANVFTASTSSDIQPSLYARVEGPSWKCSPFTLRPFACPNARTPLPMSPLGSLVSAEVNTSKDVNEATDTQKQDIVQTPSQTSPSMNAAKETGQRITGAPPVQDSNLWDQETLLHWNIVRGNHRTNRNVSCNIDNCRPPNCTCSSTLPPPGIAVKEMPQFVMLAFNDAVNNGNMRFYRELLKDLKRKNKASGCAIAATFFVSAEYLDYSLVNELFSDGNEIALHSIT